MITRADTERSSADIDACVRRTYRAFGVGSPSATVACQVSHSHGERADPSVEVVIRVGGLPRWSGWLVDKVLLYDRRWTPFDVVINGSREGTISPRNRRLELVVPPGVLEVDLASQHSGLIYHHLVVEADPLEPVLLQYTPALTFSSPFSSRMRPATLRRLPRRVTPSRQT